MKVSNDCLMMQEIVFRHLRPGLCGKQRPHGLEPSADRNFMPDQTWYCGWNVGPLDALGHVVELPLRKRCNIFAEGCWLGLSPTLVVEKTGPVEEQAILSLKLSSSLSQSHVLVWHSLLFTLAILHFHLFDIVTCSHSFHTLLVLLFYKCSLVPICKFVSYSYLNWKPAQHWCSDCCAVTYTLVAERMVFSSCLFS